MSAIEKLNLSDSSSDDFLDDEAYFKVYAFFPGFISIEECKICRFP